MLHEGMCACLRGRRQASASVRQTFGVQWPTALLIQAAPASSTSLCRPSQPAPREASQRLLRSVASAVLYRFLKVYRPCTRPRYVNIASLCETTEPGALDDLICRLSDCPRFRLVPDTNSLSSFGPALVHRPLLTPAALHSRPVSSKQHVSSGPHLPRLPRASCAHTCGSSRLPEAECS